MKDVISAEAVAASAAEPIAPAEPSSFRELRASWTPEQKTKWDMTGEEPEPSPAKPAEKKEPEPPPAEVKPDAGTGEEDQDHEPELFGTPEQQKSQRQAFSRMRREKAELKAENKLLREQRAEKPAAPAAAPKAEVKTKPTLEAPKRPRLSDAKYDVENGIALYDADSDEYEQKSREFYRAQAQAERETETQAKSQREVAQQWEADTKEMRTEHPDFDKVAFSPNTAASDVMLGVLTSMKGGARVCYHLGLNTDLAKELAEATHIPGFQNYQEIVQAAESDAKIARALGAAEALVKAEAKRILAGSKKDDPAPKPITKTAAIPPGSRVPANSAPTGDPLKDAYARGDLRAAMELENERDRAALRR